MSEDPYCIDNDPNEWTIDIRRTIQRVGRNIKKFHNLDWNLDADAICLDPIWPRTGSNLVLGDCEPYDREEHMTDLAKHKVSDLNSQQLTIYNHVLTRPSDIIVIQAGPGCGKSFVLKTIAYNQNRMINTVIYKHDLLSAFRYNSHRFTVAKYIMKLLSLQFFQYKALDQQLSSRMNSYEFFLTIISMLRLSKMSDVEGTILFLDEYTVMNKSFLLVILILLEYYKVGAIICGDRNQLQNIHNSSHTTLSSYSMARMFAQREFTMTINERCGSPEYNEIINFFASFSSNAPLDEYAFAMVSAFFLHQLVEPIRYDCIHLAATHKELAQALSIMVCNNAYPTSFYELNISASRSKDSKRFKMATETPTIINLPETERYISMLQTHQTQNGCNVELISSQVVGRFVPYIPLVVGARYYVHSHSDRSCGTLLEYNAEEQTVTMKLDNDKVVILGKTSSTGGAMFEQHLNYLMEGVESGRLYNYPIYPANFMSIHKCQGCTITNDLNLMLSKTNYQGLYVALSRVRNPSQIARVVVQNQISHLISTIINFPQYCDNRVPSVDEVRTAMVNYMFYDVTAIQTIYKNQTTAPNNNLNILSNYALQFVLNPDPLSRRNLRQLIVNFVNNNHFSVRLLKKLVTEEDLDPNLITIGKAVQYHDIVLALSCVNVQDRNVWLHEFMINNPDMANLLPEQFERNSCKYEDDKKRHNTILNQIGNLNEAYGLNVSSRDYIEAKSKLNIRVSPENVTENAKYCIRNVSHGKYLETTEFCAKVYHRYEANQICDVDWLLDELNKMLKCKLEKPDGVSRNKNNTFSKATHITNIGGPINRRMAAKNVINANAIVKKMEMHQEMRRQHKTEVAFSSIKRRRTGQNVTIGSFLKTSQTTANNVGGSGFDDDDDNTITDDSISTTTGGL